MVIESFLGTRKTDYLDLATVGSLEELEAGVRNYSYYRNHERVKLGPQGGNPVKYRLRSTSCLKGAQLSKF